MYYVKELRTNLLESHYEKPVSLARPWFLLHSSAVATAA